MVFEYLKVQGVLNIIMLGNSVQRYFNRRIRKMQCSIYKVWIILNLPAGFAVCGSERRNLGYQLDLDSWTLQQTSITQVLFFLNKWFGFTSRCEKIRYMVYLEVNCIPARALNKISENDLVLHAAMRRDAEAGFIC